MAELETINNNLREEVGRLHEQLHRFNKNAEGATRRLQSELDDAKRHHSTLSQGKET